MEHQIQGPEALSDTSPTEGSPRISPNNFTECVRLPSDELVDKHTPIPGSETVWNPRQETHTALSLVHPAFSASALPTQDYAIHAGPTARRSPPLQEHLQAPSRAPSRNPLYEWRHFSSYRAKFTRKQVQGEDPIWPTYLEDAFLDGEWLSSSSRIREVTKLRVLMKPFSWYPSWAGRNTSPMAFNMGVICSLASICG